MNLSLNDNTRTIKEKKGKETTNSSTTVNSLVVCREKDKLYTMARTTKTVTEMYLFNRRRGAWRESPRNRFSCNMEERSSRTDRTGDDDFRDC